MGDRLPRVVFDTNVLISALLAYTKRASTPPASCLDLSLNGVIQLVTSPAIIAELVHALSYPKLGITVEEAHAFAAIVTAAAGPHGLVQIEGRVSILRRDPGDNKVLETAVCGPAHYVVTGNIADFAELGARDGILSYRGIRIVTPRELVELVRRSQSAP